MALAAFEGLYKVTFTRRCALCFFRLAEGGDIVDITLEVIEDLLTVSVETSIDLPSEATQAQLKSFSYTQLLVST